MKKRVNVKIKGENVYRTGILYPYLKVVRTIKGWHKLSALESIKPRDYIDPKNHKK